MLRVESQEFKTGEFADASKVPPGTRVMLGQHQFEAIHIIERGELRKAMWVPVPTDLHRPPN